MLALAACAPGQPQEKSRDLPATQVFEAAKPAVVIVETAATVTWSVPQPEFDQSKQGQLTDRLTSLVRSGSAAPSEAALNQAALQILTDDPGAWFSLSGPRLQSTDTDYFTGSGFFITEDGYLLTNAHVVQVSDDEIKRQLVADVGRQTAGQGFLQSVRDSLAKAYRTPVSEAQAQKVASWFASVYASNLNVVSVTPRYRIAFGSHSPKDVDDHGLPIRLVTRGDPAPGKDVAVLKAEGGRFSTLPLAPRTPPRGAHLDVVGYPCGCQSEVDYDLNRALLPMLTEGSVQNELLMPAGWRATGTDAAMQHGNSGGPVLDSSGQVVGLATFREVGVTGLLASNFVVPVDVAREFTGQAGVRPAQGPLGLKYGQAIAEFDQRHYRAALPLFEQVARADPQNPYVQQYVEQAQSAIAGGRDRTPPPTPGYLTWLSAYGLHVVLAAWLLLGVLGALLVAMRLPRRARKR